MSARCTAHGLIAVFKAHNEFVTAAFFRRIYDFFIGCTFSAHTDIIHYRQIEQVVILRNICDAFCAFGKRQGTDIHAAKLH